MKYKAIFKENSNSKPIVLGLYSDKNHAIDVCLDKVHNDYCLDSRESRRQSLENFGFCICGCGPREISIEEVNE